MKYSSILIIFLLMVFQSLQAQTPVRVSVADVKMEELFIDAERERLLGNYEKAEGILKGILEKEKDEATVYFSLAQVLSKLDKNEESIKMAEQAVELESDNIWYKIYLTEIYEKTGNDLKAAKIYEDLAKSNPQTDEYYYSWAFYLIRAQEVEDAIDVYNMMEKRSGISEDLIRKKHTLYLGLGDYKKAGKELERLINAFPNQLDYQHLLAAFYMQFDQRDKAKTIYQDILKMNPDDSKALLALRGGSSVSGDNLNGLRSILEQPTISIDDKIKELLPLIQDAVTTSDPAKINSTLELTEILVNLHPEEAKAYAAYGDLLYHSGNLENAKTAYQKTLELDESVYTVWEQLMYVFWEGKDYKALAELSEEAMDVFPNQARVYFMNGLALHHLGEYEDALDILQEASFMIGGDQQLQLDLLQQMGVTHQKLKQFEAADNVFDQALALAPNSAQLLNTYSYQLAERGTQLEKAQKMVEAAMKQNPNQAVLEHTYAWVLYKKGDLKDAQKWIEKALEKDQQALFVEHYGDILLRLGDKAEATTQWKKAQSLGSDSESLQKKIESGGDL